MPPQEAGPAAKAGRRIRPGLEGEGDLSQEGRIFTLDTSVACESTETFEEECDGSQRLLHRFTYFLMFINEPGFQVGPPN